ncbi:hypothetical protein VOLCADRAFT_90135, partial [Volvox carteri f. nagariensis]
LDQLLIDEANQISITNSGDAILSTSSSGDALGALILKLVADSCSSLGDASKRVLLMVLAGLRQYLGSGLHPHTFQHDLAAQVLQCVVPSAVLHVPLPPGGPQQGDMAVEALHALIHTHLCGKAGGQAAEQHLAGCLQALSSLRDFPPLARLPGYPPGQSRVLRGVVLQEGPLVGLGAAGLLLRQWGDHGDTGGQQEGGRVEGMFGRRNVRMAPPGVRPLPAFLALSCPLDGEDITCVSAGGGVTAGISAVAAAAAGGTGVPCTGPAAAIRVSSEAARREAEEAIVELLRQRVALLADRGVQLLLLCGRPPPVAVQLCHQYGICLVAGLDEGDVARACAAGGGAAPLTRAGLSVLSAAPLGRAAAARVVGLGPRRRAVLLEFSEEQWRAAGQAACTLLLCGVTEVSVRQSVRAVRRCLISITAAIGTMARHGEEDGGGAAAGGGGAATRPCGGGGDGDGDGAGGRGGEGAPGGGECLVFVAGGGGFEGLLDLQLRELSDVARRGLTSAGAHEVWDQQEEEEEEEGGEGEAPEEEGKGEDASAAAEEGDAGEAAAAEAKLASELLASLKVLQAMAAAVSVALTGPATGGGEKGGSGSRRRAQREALLQVHALRQCQTAALQQGPLVCCGLVVPSAAFSFHGRALRGIGSEGPAAAAAAAPQAPGIGEEGQEGGIHCRMTFVRARPVLGGHSFTMVPSAAAYGVVEPAAVVASAWSHAVDIVRQVVRIDGGPVAAVSRQSRQAGGDKRLGPVVAVAGPGPALTCSASGLEPDRTPGLPALSTL